MKMVLDAAKGEKKARNSRTVKRDCSSDCECTLIFPLKAIPFIYDLCNFIQRFIVYVDMTRSKFTADACSCSVSIVEFLCLSFALYGQTIVSEKRFANQQNRRQKMTTKKNTKHWTAFLNGNWMIQINWKQWLYFISAYSFVRMLLLFVNSWTSPLQKKKKYA